MRLLSYACIVLGCAALLTSATSVAADRPLWEAGAGLGVLRPGDCRIEVDAVVCGRGHADAEPVFQDKLLLAEGFADTHRGFQV